MEIQKSDDTSMFLEIIKEKLTELLEPTEIITETVTPPDTFYSFYRNRRKIQLIYKMK